MNYVELTINGVDYKLTLNMANMVALEKALGENPLNVLMSMQENKLPQFDIITTILLYSMKKYQPKTNQNDVYNLIDNYLEEGNDIGALIKLVVAVFEKAGYFRQNTTAKAE